MLGSDGSRQATEDDAMEGEIKKYKSYQINLGISAHAYDHHYDAGAKAYYGSIIPGVGDYPFSQMQYSIDPLDRLIKQSAPGTASRMGSGKEIKLEYSANTSSDLIGYGSGFLSRTRRKNEDDQITDSFID